MIRSSSSQSQNPLFAIYRDFYSLLHTGDLQPRQPFTYRELSTRFHVSLGTLNAAMNTLKETGIISVHSRRQGSSVADISPDELWSSLQHRLAIESRAAVMASSNATDAELEELTRMAYILDKCTPADFQSKFSREYEFHSKILELSHIPSLARQTLPIMDSIVKAQLCRPNIEFTQELWSNHSLCQNCGHIELACLLSRRAPRDEMSFGMEVHLMETICHFYPAQKEYMASLDAFSVRHYDEYMAFAGKLEALCALRDDN